MVLLPERRVSRMAEWARRISGFSLVLLVVACLAHRYAFIETIGFFWVLGLVAALALTGLALAVGGFFRLWEYGEKAGRASLAATVLSAIVLVPYLGGAWLVLSNPALNDISTDLLEPPEFARAARARSAEMNQIGPIGAEAADLQVRNYPDVSARRYDASTARVLSAVAAVIAARGWTPYAPLPTDADAGEVVIEVEAPTWLVRLPADAAIRLTDEGESTFVDMRLAARYGLHDLGDGARRIRAFMADLDAEFNRQSLEIIDIPASGEEEDAVD